MSQSFLSPFLRLAIQQPMRRRMTARPPTPEMTAMIVGERPPAAFLLPGLFNSSVHVDPYRVK